MSEQRDNRSRTLIRELYQLSEAGAFDNIDAQTAETSCNFLLTLLNPTITYEQAEKIFGKKKELIRNDVSRKLPTRKKINLSTNLFKYKDLKDILSK